MEPKHIALYPTGKHENKPVGGRNGFQKPFTNVDEIRELLIEDNVDAAKIEDLAAEYKQQPVPFRAVTPLVHLGNRSKSYWKKLQPGDWALFYRDRHFYACATITFTGHLPALAQDTFGEHRTDKDEIWDLFCFFKTQYDEFDKDDQIPFEDLDLSSDGVLRYFKVVSDPAKVSEIVEMVKQTSKIHNLISVRAALARG